MAFRHVFGLTAHMPEFFNTHFHYKKPIYEHVCIQ